MVALTTRWTPLEYHPVQARLMASRARFRVVPAGRRSGKTELAKRFTIMECMKCVRLHGRFIVAAPTRDQARRIYWEDLKALVPKDFIIGEPRESEMKITFAHNRATLEVTGMDVPQRVEGAPLDGIILDEYADMKERAWNEHVRPALSTRGRPGWAWFIGVPEGRNHYYNLAMKAQDPRFRPEWEYFHWKSRDIIDAKEIEAAMSDMDELSFKQEYEGDFVTFEGRVYYPFERDVHARKRLMYFHDMPIVLCLDFNVAPGPGAILQEQRKNWYPDQKGFPKALADEFSAVIGQIHIPKNSNTERVCKQFISMYGHHKSEIYVYGDATGGARGTSAIEGSDWDIVRKILKPHFGDRVKFRVGESNPQEKIRVNCVNSRLRTADGIVRMIVDPVSAPEVVEDFEGVTWLDGADCVIDKWDNPRRTHWSDAIGYYMFRKYPIGAAGFSTQKFTQ